METKYIFVVRILKPLDKAPTLKYNDPYLIPSTSTRNKIGRAVWKLIYIALFRPTPRPLHAWRAFLLRLFGAKIGENCHIYPRAQIWAPWNLNCEDVVTIADEAVVYNPNSVHLESHAIVSQQAYLCGASHDIDDPTFKLVSGPICLKRFAWVCARATVLPNVTLHEGSVLALSAVATHDLEPWTVYAGVPARKLRLRNHKSA